MRKAVIAGVNGQELLRHHYRLIEINAGSCRLQAPMSILDRYTIADRT